MRQIKGFTILELMITIAVMAVLLGIAVPNFTDFMVRTRLSGQVTEFMAALNYARSEAIKRAHNVTVCKSANGTACGGIWSNGWIVCADVNNDGDCADTGETTPLRVFSGLPDGYALKTDKTNYQTRITYTKLGMESQSGADQPFMVFCADGDTSRAKGVRITATRPRFALDAEITSCGSYE